MTEAITGPEFCRARQNRVRRQVPGEGVGSIAYVLGRKQHIIAAEASVAVNADMTRVDKGNW